MHGSKIHPLHHPKFNFQSIYSNKPMKNNHSSNLWGGDNQTVTVSSSKPVIAFSIFSTFLPSTVPLAQIQENRLKINAIFLIFPLFLYKTSLYKFYFSFGYTPKMWCFLRKRRDYRFIFWMHFIFVLLECSFPVGAILDPIDYLALQSIRKSLDDLPGSNYFASWDFTADPCNFAGVYCDGDRVIALNLGDPRAGSPGLTGRIDPAIGKLSALTEFTIVPGRIIGSLPQTLSQLKNLRFLAVGRNFISGDIPATLGKLRGLQTLDLSFNQFYGSIPWSIGTLPSLLNVILCYNKLSGSVPPFVSQTLTRLDLKHNDLSGSISPLGLPPSLQYLSLSWNRLTGPVDRLLTRLDRLSFLDLSMNQFTGCIPGKLFTFPLTSLQLQRNQFSGPVEPIDQVSIPTVDLSFNRFSGWISPLFSIVQNLYLNNNKFTGEVPGSLVDQLLSASMHILYLQHNYLTGMEIIPVAAIPVSSSLCLQYNCMVLPVRTPCPLKAGKQKTRPAEQCIRWKV